MSESQFSARKRGVTHVEDGESGSTASYGEQTDVDTPNVPHNDDEETKRIMRKVDWHLIPPLMALYIISFMDRSNIGNAKVAGMNADLELTGTQYNMALTVFFFPYALFEVPSNIFLKMMRPSRWLMILVIAWGTVMAMQGIVKNYNQLLVTRTLLGFTEAGFFPAASYLLTTWYPRWEVQTRLAIFFTGASLAGAFSGLLAFAIQHMDGIAGLGGWRWIFILEGILTVLMGCTIPFLLPDSPKAAKFLTLTEKETIISRLQHDAGPASAKTGIDDSFKWAFLKEALLDWKIYLACIIFWGNSVSFYGFTFASPTIIHELGYTAAQAQLLTVPIYFVGTCSTMFFAYNADRLQKRWPFIVIPFGIAVVGFVGLLAVPHPRLPGLTYTFLFFIPAGLYPSVIGCISWVGNNLAPSYKRAIGMALLLTIGNLGGAVGSNIFLGNQAPHYWLGYGFSLAIIVCGIFATLILRFAIKRINEKRDQIPEAETLAKYTEDELVDMGDKSPLYRYVI
ncbi:major facilitator superfamily domain-containing protein [Ilyonectria robusta]|uniref:major facilitator superfamily domain-containing protein n=1 Tax=Ilyonectria robusta TaxID=1079257 RepID=UPI001E8D9634|nr:major facilitator superfamily domain-containing protein [Ilyonectria robusta]KAH8666219.1 major facilitator superfamily domain-containing protein [Ilyonectria robusta]